MQYVMVPVPEEHVEGVQRFLRLRVRPTELGEHDGEYDVAAVDRLFVQADEPLRALLLLVAEATLRAEEIILADAAAALGRSEHETLGAVIDLNNRCKRDGGWPFTIVPREGLTLLPDGTTDNAWRIVMSEEAAQHVEAAASRSRATLR